MSIGEETVIATWCKPIIQGYIASFKEKEAFMYYRDKDGKYASRIDGCVYTVNRQFRFPCCSKFASLRSLVCIPNSSLLRYLELIDEHRKNPRIVAEWIRAMTVSSPPDVTRKWSWPGQKPVFKRNKQGVWLPENNGFLSPVSSMFSGYELPSHENSSMKRLRFNDDPASCVPRGPIPNDLADLLVRNAVPVAHQGAIVDKLELRESAGHLLVLVKSRLTQCHNRQHKSNHSFFIVNLGRKTIRQKCHDDACDPGLPIDISDPETIDQINKFLVEMAKLKLNPLLQTL